MNIQKVTSILCLAAVWALGACTPKSGKNSDSGTLQGYAGFPNDPQKGTSINLDARDIPMPEPDAKAPPLEVIHRSPEGSVGTVRELAVIFNQPLYAMGLETRRGQLEEMFTITPPVKGQLLYLAGDTLKIELDKPLTQGNRYTVTLKKGVKAVSGRTLDRDVTWHILTPRPQVLGVDTHSRHVAKHNGIHPDDSFVIRFSDRVNEGNLRPYLSLTVGKKPWPFVTAPVGDSTTDLRLWSDRPFPLGSAVRVAVKAGFTLGGGPLPAVTPYKGTFLVHPKTLGVELSLDPYVKKYKIYVNPLEPNLKITFTDYLDEGAFLGTVQLRPAEKTAGFGVEEYSSCTYVDRKKKGQCGRTFVLKGHLRPHTTYTVTVKKGVRDLHGHTLSATEDLSFITGGYPPGLFLPDDQDALREPYNPYAFKYVNLKRLSVETRSLPPDSLIPFLRCLALRVPREPAPTPYSCARHIPPTKVTMTLGGPPEKILKKVIIPGKGLKVLSFSTPEIVDSDKKPMVFHRTVLTSRLGVHTRLTQYNATVWVTDLETAKPLKGVTISIHSSKGWPLFSGVTDAAGLFQAAIPEDALAQWDAAAYVVCSLKEDVAYTRLGGRYSRSPREGIEHPEKEKVSEAPENPFSSWIGSTYYPDWSRGVTHTGYLSTERSLYRPGETVHFHGAVRAFNRWHPSPASNATIDLTFTDPSGSAIATKKLTTDTMGVFRGTFTMPARGRLGMYSVSLSHGGRTLAHHSVKAKEYRPPRFTASVRPQKRSYHSREKARIFLTGDWLFGGKMGGARYTVSMERYRSSRYLRGKNRGFFVGAPAYQIPPVRRKFALYTGVLDKGGTKTIEVPLDRLDGAHSPWYETHTALLDVTSAALRTVGTWRDYEYLPSTRLPAATQVRTMGQTLRTELRVLDPQWNPVPGEKLRVTFHPARPKPSDSWYYTTFPDYAHTLWTKEVPQGAFSFGWPKACKTRCGFLLVQTVDAAGRPANTQLMVCRPHKPLPRAVQAAARPETKPQRYFDIVLDRSNGSYSPGETAKITVRQKNATTYAMLFVEREEVFKAIPLYFDAKGEAKVSLPVSESYMDWVMLKVIGLRKGKDLRLYSPFITTEQTLSVTSPLDHLRVHISPERRDYHPGEKVKVKVKVSDPRGRPIPAHLVIMAVDEAVLNLSGYRLPDPYYSLRHTPRRSVVADDTRLHLYNLFIPIWHVDHSGTFYGRRLGDFCDGTGGLGMGGGGFGSGGGSAYGMGRRMSRVGFARGQGRRPPVRQKVRRVFLTTAWHATLATDKRGAVETAFTLPDNVTSFKIMAFAVDARRGAGVGYNTVKASRNLMALPSLPRFLRRDDTSQTGVTVYYKGKKAFPGSVSVSLSGGAIELTGPKTQRGVIPAGAGTTFRFGVRARDVGTSLLTFTVAAGDERDTIEVPLTVKPWHLPKTVSVSGDTETAVRHAITLMDGVSEDFGHLKVSMASTALVGVEDGMDQLVHYPYGCLEQKTSGLIPLLGVHAMGNRFSMKLPGKTVEYINAGVKAILAMQRSSGGFSYWPSNSSTVYPWLNAYALLVLSRLKRSGIPIPTQALSRVVEYLRPYGYPVSSWQIRRHYLERAMVVWALAEHGVSNHNTILQLAKNRQNQSLFSRAIVLGLLGRLPATGERDKLVKEMLREVTSAIMVKADMAYVQDTYTPGYYSYMDSNGRSAAVILMALLKVAPDHPLIVRLVRWFLRGRPRGQFRNTQEAGWGLLAMMEYARQKEKTVPDFQAGVWLGRHRLFTTAFSGRTTRPTLVTLPMSRLHPLLGKRSPLTIAKRGAGRLYYTARLRYSPKNLPTEAKAQGFNVSKTVRVLGADGKTRPAGTPMSSGDTVWVQVTVRTRVKRDFVVIDDPLPAGMEAIDTSYVNSTATLDSRALVESSRHDHRELRDDRVVWFIDNLPRGTHIFRYLARVSSVGTFRSPPVHAEEMYNPERYGHGVGRVVTFR